MPAWDRRSRLAPRVGAESDLDGLNDAWEGFPDCAALAQPQIRGWSNYHRHVVSKRVFSRVDNTPGTPGNSCHGHIRAGRKHSHGMVGAVHRTEGLQLSADGLVDVAAGSMVRRDDDGVLRARGVALGDGLDALLRISNLSEAALRVEHGNTLGGFVLAKVLHGFPQFGVFLTHDVVKPRGAHPGLLQMLQGVRCNASIRWERESKGTRPTASLESVGPTKRGYPFFCSRY